MLLSSKDDLFYTNIRSPLTHVGTSGEQFSNSIGVEDEDNLDPSVSGVRELGEGEGLVCVCVCMCCVWVCV
jgi:hypothetical protein